MTYGRLNYEKQTDILTLGLLATLNSQLSILHAQGSAFTYQGRLNTNGTPANGLVELQCTMWNALSNGTQVASATPATTIVTLTNGLFTVSLDFGTTAFDGSDRYLQIEARTVIGPFTLLTPRQKITATPYALLAGKLSGTVASGGLGGAYENAVTFSNAANIFNGAFSGNGGGLSNLNAATLGGLSASNFWKLGGNAGTTAGVNFLGTTDNQPLELKVNNQRGLRLEPVFTVTNSGPGYSIIYSNGPNLIGGSPVNTADAGVIGSFIGGGGLGGYYQDTGFGYVFGSSLPNRVSANFAFIGGGYSNTIQTVADGSAIGGGVLNTIQTNASGSTIAGGSRNTIQTSAIYSTIGGGSQNTMNSGFATIGGGSNNKILTNSNGSTIGGGGSNLIDNDTRVGTIAGGQGNEILIGSEFATIGGGANNIVETNADYSVIGGGSQNVIQSNPFNLGASTISGGQRNTIQTNGSNRTIGGGEQNIIQFGATWATIPGGYLNVAAGDLSFAAGYRAKALHNGAFVWADSQNADFSSTANNQFLIRAANGVGIGTAQTPLGGLRVHSGGLAVTGASSPNYAGASGVFIETGGGLGQIYAFNYTPFAPLPLVLDTGGGHVGVGRTPAVNELEVEGNASKSVAGSWLANSDARIKTDIKPVQNALAALEKVRLVSFRYNDAYRATHRGVEDRRYLNVVAQEFREVFPDRVKTSGEKLPNGDDILQVDTYPLTIYSAAAIQELNARTEGQLKARDTEIQQLKQRLEKLEEFMNQEKEGGK